MARPYLLTQTNPNDVSGGGGCACNVVKTANQEGPFLVFPFTDMENAYSPHNVICARCAGDCLNMEVVAGGETGAAPVEAEAVEEEPEEDLLEVLKETHDELTEIFSEEDELPEV